ncbi:UDP-N-acetylmuramoylalanyl-D-glutamate--2,6-diaminopimelate ligase, partial [Limosilactobacillus fermentum]|nr:UDP-N-acetylmuramoylalanyl-D-glutamate--2,6-diaminopimelate ligase [Limosilactobacillus fermentum]
LTVIGYTGTKGKTTSVYFTRHVMAKALGKVVAQLSSIDECLDGETFIPAHLTTPESLDLFRMMKEAVDNQMKYLVMEVSSQAYKKSRVFGLPLDIGVFLNISPDHISPVEHPSFEDY